MGLARKGLFLQNQGEGQGFMFWVVQRADLFAVARPAARPGPALASLPLAAAAATARGRGGRSVRELRPTEPAAIDSRRRRLQSRRGSENERALADQARTEASRRCAILGALTGQSSSAFGFWKVQRSTACFC